MGDRPKTSLSDAFQRLYDDKTISEWWMPKSLVRHRQMPDRLKKWSILLYVGTYEYPEVCWTTSWFRHK